MKEKSLYRYAISRKLSRDGFNKSQGNLLASAGGRRHKTELSMEIPQSILDFENKEKSVVSNEQKEIDKKDRRFRRKSRHATESANSGISPL